MAELRNQTLRLPQEYRKAGLDGTLHRRDIAEYFANRLPPMLSKMKDNVRKVSRAFPLFVRGKKFTRYEFSKV